jgi:TPR repeat protein
MSSSFRARPVGILVVAVTIVTACAPSPKSPAEMGVSAEDARCQGGSGAACLAVANAYGQDMQAPSRNGFAVGEFVRRRNDYWMRACRAGTVEACDKLANHLSCRELRDVRAMLCDKEPTSKSCYAAARDCGDPEWTPKRLGYLTKACNAATPREDPIWSCDEAYGLLSKQKDPPPEERRRLLKKACALGGSFQCTTLGSLLEKGEFGATDEAGALKSYAEGCDRKDAGGCKALLSLLGRRCSRGVHDECVIFAKGFRRSDPVKAVGILESSCRAGHAPACAELEAWKRP